MGRDDGFPIADVAVGLLDDDKVRKLWRLLGDQSAMCEAMTTHQAVLLASWGAGRRATIDEACPLWLSPSRPVLDALASVGLLDGKGRIPAKAWSAWFGPAATRRDAARAAGREGNRIRWGQGRDSGATPDPIGSRSPSGRQAGPSDIHTVPSSARPRSPRGRAVGGPSTLGEALAGTAFGAAIGLDAKEAK